MPTRSQRVLAHRAVDAGAQLVVAHHPHVLQGVEYYRGAAIAYSLGNLVFRNPRPMTFPTGVLVATLTRSPSPELVSLELVPAYIDRQTYTPHPAGSRARRMRRNLARMSRPLGTHLELANGRIRFLAP
jgi:poly-gamma-glutamate synthesis protein (capsule biosynthesis protein)